MLTKDEIKAQLLSSRDKPSGIRSSIRMGPVEVAWMWLDFWYALEVLIKTPSGNIPFSERVADSATDEEHAAEVEKTCASVADDILRFDHSHQPSTDLLPTFPALPDQAGAGMDDNVPM